MTFKNFALSATALLLLSACSDEAEKRGPTPEDAYIYSLPAAQQKAALSQCSRALGIAAHPLTIEFDIGSLFVFATATQGVSQPEANRLNDCAAAKLLEGFVPSEAA